MTINGRPALTPVQTVELPEYGVFDLARIAQLQEIADRDEPLHATQWKILQAFEAQAAAGGPAEAYAAEQHERMIEVEANRLRQREEARRRVAAETAKARGGLRVHSAAQLEDIPTPKPLIHRWLYEGTDARIFGASTHGKTFLAVDIALSVSVGRLWCGNTVTQGRVLYLAAEDPAGVALRARAWQAHHGVAAGDQFLLVDGAIALAAPEDLIELVRQYQPTLVVIDTQHRASVGLEENSASDATLMLESLRRIREAGAPGCSTLLVHHSGHDGQRARGSSSAFAALDIELKVSRDEDGVITIRCEKTKNGENGRTHELELVAVDAVVNADGDPAAVAAMVNPLPSGAARAGGPNGPILPVVPGLPTEAGCAELYAVMSDLATASTGLTLASAAAELKARAVDALSAREKADKATVVRTKNAAGKRAKKAWGLMRDERWLVPVAERAALERPHDETQSVPHRVLSPEQHGRVLTQGLEVLFHPTELPGLGSL